jgi:hypothetical protein
MRIQLTFVALAVGVMSFGQMSSFGGAVQYGQMDLTNGQHSQVDANAWIFDNTTTGTGYFYAAPEADDLHMVGVGYLDAYKIGYYSPNGVTGCTTRFWTTDANDNTAVYLGGYYVGGLAQGAYIYTITVAPTIHLGPDVWMSQEYDMTGAGALMYDPPTIGTSHNYFADPTAAMPNYSWFGGTPVANFCEAVHVVPEPGTIAALAAGLFGLLGLRRRK